MECAVRPGRHFRGDHRQTGRSAAKTLDAADVKARIAQLGGEIQTTGQKRRSSSSASRPHFGPGSFVSVAFPSTDYPKAERTLIRKLLALALAGVSLTATGQQWPTKPVRFVVPFAPGGTSEIVARCGGNRTINGVGPDVFVENKPGGAGVIAMTEVSKADPMATPSSSATLAPWR